MLDNLFQSEENKTNNRQVNGFSSNSDEISHNHNLMNDHTYKIDEAKRKSVLKVCEYNATIEWSALVGEYNKLKSNLTDVECKVSRLISRRNETDKYLKGEKPSLKNIITLFMVASVMVLGEIELLNSTLSYNLNLDGIQGWLVSFTIMGSVFALKIFIQRGFFDRSEFKTKFKRTNALSMIFWGLIVVSSAITMYTFIGLFRAESMSWELTQGFDTLMQQKPWLGYGLVGSISVSVLVGVSTIWAYLGTKMKLRNYYNLNEKLDKKLNSVRELKSEYISEIRKLESIFNKKQTWWAGRIEELRSDKMRKIRENQLKAQQTKNELDASEEEEKNAKQEQEESDKAAYHKMYENKSIHEIMERVMRNDMLDNSRHLLNGDVKTYK